MSSKEELDLDALERLYEQERRAPYEISPIVAELMDKAPILIQRVREAEATIGRLDKEMAEYISENVDQQARIAQLERVREAARAVLDDAKNDEEGYIAPGHWEALVTGLAALEDS